MRDPKDGPFIHLRDSLTEFEYRPSRSTNLGGDTPLKRLQRGEGDDLRGWGADQAFSMQKRGEIRIPRLIILHIHLFDGNEVLHFARGPRLTLRTLAKETESEEDFNIAEL
ncbi:hypothetical protein CDAR_176471 [Caerostris darwini]|uniref:Uncharacterized protein n=1 Tax=Caerostris darwini TaxID=1538125 RepID=A0AAV4Q7Y6_9ARAC|nr:hypothetical protein CDAR_176471 [Caerostris darwini]